MSTLREAAKEALRWMEHARLHLTIKERMHPDGLSLYDSAAEALRAALTQPKTELRDQHKAFTHWYFGLRGINEANFSPEDLAWAAWKAALAQPEPPRDEWRPASEPPDTTRSVLIWLRFGDVETFGKTLGGPSGFAFQNGAITHWRDVTPPTEGAK